MLVLLLACSPPHITRERWQSMSPHDQELYVSSMMGGETARQQKGGTAKRYSRAAPEYVARINAAYARGDSRDVTAIFSEMADRN